MESILSMVSIAFFLSRTKHFSHTYQTSRLQVTGIYFASVQVALSARMIHVQLLLE